MALASHGRNLPRPPICIDCHEGEDALGDLLPFTDAIAQNWQSDSEYDANMDEHERNRLLADWHDAVIKVKTGL